MNICITGDSISHGIDKGYYAPRSMAHIMSFFLKGNFHSIAFPSDKIQDQQAKWAALSSELKLTFDYVININGNNEITYLKPVADSVAVYQSMMNDIRSSIKSSCKIVCCTLTPTDYYKLANVGHEAETVANRAAFNEAIKGNGASPVTGQDVIVIDHTTVMDDGAGALKSIYFENGTDRLHPNFAGREIVVGAILNKLKSLNLIQFDLRTSP